MQREGLGVRAAKLRKPQSEVAGRNFLQRQCELDFTRVGLLPLHLVGLGRSIHQCDLVQATHTLSAQVNRAWTADDELGRLARAQRPGQYVGISHLEARPLEAIESPLTVQRGVAGLRGCLGRRSRGAHYEPTARWVGSRRELERRAVLPGEA